jgi:TRAP-type C4-dicarboxylate transport system permease small subunit
LQTVTKVKNTSIKLATGIASVIMFLMMAMVVIEVLMRWILDRSTMVSNDFVAYGMGIVFYFGALKALNDGVFVRMDVLYDIYRGRVKKAVNLVCDFLLLFFNLDVMYYFFIMLRNTFERHLKSTNIYQTPLWLPRLLIFIGITVLTVYLVCRIIEDFQAKPQKYSNKQLQLMEEPPEGAEAGEEARQ